MGHGSLAPRVLNHGNKDVRRTFRHKHLPLYDLLALHDQHVYQR